MKIRKGDLVYIDCNGEHSLAVITKTTKFGIEGINIDYGWLNYLMTSRKLKEKFKKEYIDLNYKILNSNIKNSIGFGCGKKFVKEIIEKDYWR